MGLFPKKVVKLDEHFLISLVHVFVIVRDIAKTIGDIGGEFDLFFFRVEVAKGDDSVVVARRGGSAISFLDAPQFEESHSIFNQHVLP